MSKRIFALIAVVLSVSLFSGCNISFLSPEDTIKAPGATGFYAGAQKALENAVGNEITLKYPLVDGNRSAFCVSDFDGDGRDEILAFYQPKAKGSACRINLLSQVEGQWQSVQGLEPVGSDLLKVNVSDLDGDGTLEVVTGWTVSTTKSNQLCVYKLENGRFVQRAGETYTSYTISNIDRQGQDEIAVVNLDTENKQSGMTFYSFADDQFTVYGHIPLDGSVTSYTNIISADLNSMTPAVYIDAFKTADTMITELVYLKNGRLYNPFADPETGENTKTLRRSKLVCRDINEDSFIEIPFMSLLPGYETMDDAHVQYITDWSYFDGEDFDTVFSAWYCRDESYRVEFDAAWRSGATLLYDSVKKTAVFYEWDSAAGVLKNEIAQVTSLSAADYAASPPADVTELETDSDRVYFCTVKSGSPLSVSGEKLKLRFKFVTE